MNDDRSFDALHVNNINLWAHVGVLEDERLFGQEFVLDITLWLDFSKAIQGDDLLATADYSIAIKGLQRLSFALNCLTIELFSEKVLDYLETVYGSIPMQISLTKTKPPIAGFTGTVSIQRVRNQELLN